MDTISLMYFAEAAKDLNFTKTAQRLFISQQTLSNHIARLETYYQVKLFERKPHLMLTYAGESLLDFARNYKISEDNLRTVLTDISQKEAGQLRIGCSPHRTTITMPVLAEQFAQKYPNVQLHFYNHHSRQLVDMLLNGELDCAIAVDKVSSPLLISTTLFTDWVYLMVSRKLLATYYKGRTEALIQKSREKGADLADFMLLPFVDVRSANIVRDVFASCELHPNFAVTINYPQFTLPSFYENIAASIVTGTVYAYMKDTMPEDILFFRVNLPSRNVIHNISFIRPQKRHMSTCGKYFFQLAIDYFAELEKML